MKIICKKAPRFKCQKTLKGGQYSKSDPAGTADMCRSLYYRNSLHMLKDKINNIQIGLNALLFFFWPRTRKTDLQVHVPFTQSN